MIQFDAVHKRFPNGTTAVHDLSLRMPEGAVTVLVGSSGCGKTTTLRMINRMVDPTSGTIRVGGKDVLQQDAADLRRSIGYVIQQSGLFPHRTVLDNIATVPLLLGWGRKKARARAAELLETVGLAAEAGRRYPHQLSGGQQQRVGVAYGMAEDSDAFAVTRETAAKYGLTSLADLKKQNGKLVIGAAAEVKTGEVGVVGLKEVYGVEFKEFKSLDSSGPLVKGALKKGDVDVANLFTTDTDILDNGWVVLTDPKNLIPGQHIVPLIADRKADSTVRKTLAELGNVLTTADLTELNRKVDKDKKDPEDVADAYAKEKGLTR
ncbi:glycine betaine ABC transporter substrate-binding protein [Streptomyces sp. ADMS]|uniref:glycine betaine ABC transporter substrate-binding protein n=1 Tax=Streptomyces sp. ADMS TaxID=3071415 RepID=UPI00296E44B2|nr:glycine betaine ABC transporter substrate-binding protein [Streptomyces sp. ADMS]MDW4906024.1 glycine betaine ABC transporter substrate-binding protein [Streptomyces sp. ADMS]